MLIVLILLFFLRLTQNLVWIVLVISKVFISLGYTKPCTFSVGVSCLVPKKLDLGCQFLNFDFQSSAKMIDNQREMIIFVENK